MKKSIWFGLVAVGLTGLTLTALADEAVCRRELSLDGSGWTCDGLPVVVPHTWNATDSADGRTDGLPPTQFPGYVVGNSVSGNGYVRKLVTYVRDLPDPVSGRRYFIHFEGVSQKATVRVNGRFVGRHVGAFTPFCLEITSALHPAGNWLEVDADNSFDPDVPPINADFSLCGGIYRTVKLIETGEHGIDPTRPVRLWPDAATGVVRAEVPLLNGGVTMQEIRVDRPKLWTPEEPTLYSVRIEAEGDSVVRKIGFRTVEIRGDGFYLNGVKRKVRGVNRHQDLEGKGWACSPEDETRDIRMIKEMGCDGIRLAHYPQSEHVYELCDEIGLLVWSEIPIVNDMTMSENFLSNCRTIAREAVTWRGNHPCIAWWSVFNEIYNGVESTKPGTFEPGLRIVRDDVRALDRTRPIVGATCKCEWKQELNEIPDSIGLNIYPGWYEKMDMDAKLDWFVRQNWSNQVVAVSEYGAGSCVDHHANPLPRWIVSATPFHPEEYQTRVHMENYRSLKRRSDVWGTFVWAMFDFGADNRNEGARAGINDKGLVTRDRLVRKDAFYLYQANWTQKPMLHVAGKRMSETMGAVVDVIGFTNLKTDVELFVNGRKVAVRRPDEIASVSFEAVPLDEGRNELRLRCGNLEDLWVVNRKRR